MFSARIYLCCCTYTLLEIEHTQSLIGKFVSSWFVPLHHLTYTSLSVERGEQPGGESVFWVGVHCAAAGEGPVLQQEGSPTGLLRCSHWGILRSPYFISLPLPFHNLFNFCFPLHFLSWFPFLSVPLLHFCSCCHCSQRFLSVECFSWCTHTWRPLAVLKPRSTPHKQ